MTNLETSAKDYDQRASASYELPLPSCPCIRIEDHSEAVRISAIDNEWDALSVAPTQDSVLQALPTRPRFETLPGLGSVTQTSAATESEWSATLDGEPSARSARSGSAPPPAACGRSGRSAFLRSTLTATLSLSFAVVAMLAFRSSPGTFAPAPQKPSEQATLAAAMANPALTSASSQAPAPARFAEAVPAATASKTELPAKPQHKGKQLPPSLPAASARQPAPRQATASNHRTRKNESIATDNPY